MFRRTVFSVFLVFLALFFWGLHFYSLSRLDSCIEKGLSYLLTQQNPDGSFKHYLADDEKMTVNLRKMGNIEATMFISCALKMAEFSLDSVFGRVEDYLLSVMQSGHTWSFFIEGDEERYSGKIPNTWIDPVVHMTSLGHLLLADRYHLTASEITDLWERYEENRHPVWGLHRSFFLTPPPSLMVTLSNPVYIQESVLSLMVHQQFAWSTDAVLKSLQVAFKANKYWDHQYYTFYHPVLNMHYFTWLLKIDSSIPIDMLHLLINQFEDRFLVLPLGRWDVYELSAYLAAKSFVLDRMSLASTRFLDQVYLELRSRQLENGAWEIDAMYRFDYPYKAVRAYEAEYKRNKAMGLDTESKSLVYFLKQMDVPESQYMGSRGLTTAFSLYALSQYQLLR